MSELPQFKTEHFKFYRTPGVRRPERRVVGLKGQFEGPKQRPRRHYAVKMTHLGNPVSKNGSRIRNRVTHLAWYYLSGPREPERTVVIENQFGKATLVLGDPGLLLVPAIKQKYPRPRRAKIPIDVSHFKGYRILDYDYHKVVNVKLKDQFDVKPMATGVYPPFFFCVPVEKWIGKKKYPVRNPKEHLTIYPTLVRRYRERRSVWDQFGGDILREFYCRSIAVPTVKHQVLKGIQLEG